MQAAVERDKRQKTALAAAVAHPTRIRCLVVLAERVASPVEIAKEVRQDVGHVGYHVATLRDAGLIELVDTRPVRGAVEHFYRAVDLPCMTAEQESELSPAERHSFAESVLSIYAVNASHALEAGTLLDRPDHHLTRVSMDIDQEGWEELVAAYMELYNRAFEIKALAAGRMGKTDDKPIRVMSFQSLFEVPSTLK